MRAKVAKSMRRFAAKQEVQAETKYTGPRGIKRDAEKEVDYAPTGTAKMVTCRRKVVKELKKAYKTRRAV